MRSNIVIVLILLLLQACSSTGSRGRLAPVVDAAGERASVPAPPERDRVRDDGARTLAYRAPARHAYRPSPPVQALLNKAEAQYAAGDLNAAAATLERALRIEQRNPHLWNRLARIRLAQGDRAQAASLAAKSNTLAVGDETLRRDNARIITAARGG